VVAGQIPPYSVVAGNPARVLRRRFEPQQIEVLLRLAWWDWPIDRILAHEALIVGGDVAGLVAASGG
jgi:virginiamycin A acetyltransferase